MTVSLADMARIGGVIHVTTDERPVGYEMSAKDMPSAFIDLERRLRIGSARRDVAVRERVLDALDADIKATGGKALTAEQAATFLWYALNGPEQGDTTRRLIAKELREHGMVPVRVIGTGGAYRIGRKFDPGPSARKVAEATLAVDVASGAGYPIDRYLRVVLDDYVTRRISGNDEFHLMPSALAFEAFLQPRSFEGQGRSLHAAQLRTERDHAFDVGDFLEVTASGAIPGNGIDHILGIEEGVIHSFSPLVPKARTLSDGTDTVVIGGFTCIRRSTRIHWCMLGGPVRDLAAETEALRGMRDDLGDEVRTVGGLGDADRVANPQATKVAALDGTDDVWTNVLWGVFDTKHKIHLARGLTSEIGWTLDVNLDRLPEQMPSVAAHVLSRLPLDLMTEAAESCLGLPAYFAARVYYTAEERRQTHLAGSVLRPGTEKKFADADEVRKVHVRIVKTLHPLPKATPNGPADRKYTPPRFQVEIGGGYRTLRPGAIGKGPDGRPEFERTWVREHERWKKQPKRPHVIHVKQPVIPALEAVGEGMEETMSFGPR